MPDTQELSSLLACPRCDRTPLEIAAGAWRCLGCNVDFPIIDGLPWMFAEPAATLDEWRGRLHFSLRRLDEQHRRLETALKEARREATRRRLTLLREATAGQAARLGTLLAPLGIAELTADAATYLALRTRLPPDQGLLTYYTNLHRDWAWGDAENERSLELVTAALAGRERGTTLVIGAGAARLAYDLHAALPPGRTVALDFNPLLLAAAQRVTHGEVVELYEFPLAPRRIEDQAVLRRLAAPAAAPAGLDFVLADAHRPPFGRATFTTIVTPWLVDILPETFDALTARINHLLTADGCWVNFGSLSFHDPDPALNYSLEECAAVLEENGFAAPQIGAAQLPYMASPASRHARQEHVVTWRADKIRAARAPERYRALPEWLVRGIEPVPLSPSFRTQIMSTRIHAFIMSLIDGRRTLKDIAKMLVEQQLLTPAEAEPAVRSFLIRMFDDSRRQSTY